MPRASAHRDGEHHGNSRRVLQARGSVRSSRDGHVGIAFLRAMDHDRKAKTPLSWANRGRLPATPEAPTFRAVCISFSQVSRGRHRASLGTPEGFAVITPGAP